MSQDYPVFMQYKKRSLQKGADSSETFLTDLMAMRKGKPIRDIPLEDLT